MFGKPGELVGHGLLGDQLVQGDVLDRGRGLAEQVEEDLALGAGEGVALAGDRHRADRLAGLPDVAERAGEREGSVALLLDRSALAQRPLLGRQRGVAHRLGAAARLGLGADLAAQRDQAVVGLAGADRGLDEDRQQRLAIEAGGERLADPLHRLLDLDPLAAQLVHLLAEPVAHPVELARQAGHLVVAADRDLARRSRRRRSASPRRASP